MRKRIRINLGTDIPTSMKDTSRYEIILMQTLKILSKSCNTFGRDSEGFCWWDVDTTEEEFNNALQAINELLRKHHKDNTAVISIENIEVEDTVEKPQVAEVYRKPRMPRSSSSINEPPDYLKGKVSMAENASPSILLSDGQWCGHGEPEYGVFNVEIENEKIFFLQLPDLEFEDELDELMAPVVMAHSASGITFPIYDPRKHPASIFYPEDGATEYEASPLQSFFHCSNCEQERFKIAVGFEIPGDSISPNDTSWYALAVQCVSCGWQNLIFDDETA